MLCYAMFWCVCVCVCVCVCACVRVCVCVRALRSLTTKSKRHLRKAASRYDSVFLNSKSVSCSLLAAGGSTALTLKVARGQLRNGLAGA